VTSIDRRTFVRRLQSGSVVAHGQGHPRRHRAERGALVAGGAVDAVVTKAGAFTRLITHEHAGRGDALHRRSAGLSKSELAGRGAHEHVSRLSARHVASIAGRTVLAHGPGDAALDRAHAVEAQAALAVVRAGVSQTSHPVGGGRTDGRPCHCFTKGIHRAVRRRVAHGRAGVCRRRRVGSQADAGDAVGVLSAGPRNVHAVLLAIDSGAGITGRTVGCRCADGGALRLVGH